MTITEVASTQTNIEGLFKRKYLKLVDSLKGTKEDHFSSKFAEFENKAKLGESVQISVDLTHEHGYTLGGQDGGVYNLNASRASVNKQARVRSSALWMTTKIPTEVITRGASDDQVFEKTSKRVIKKNYLGHKRLQEFLNFYGQDPYGLGKIDIAVDANGFTNGVNTSSKKIAIEWATFSPGIFTGCEGMPIMQYVGDDGYENYIAGIDPENRIITLENTPAANGSEDSFICLHGHGTPSTMTDTLEMLGVKGILTKDGSLFDINNNTYSQFKGTRYSVGTKLTFAKLEAAGGKAWARGLEGDATAFVAFDSWSNLMQELAAKRSFDGSYSKNEGINGFKEIKFAFYAGEITVMPHRMVRNSDAFLLENDMWIRVGSTEVTMEVDGHKMVQEPINDNAWTFRSFSDTQPFCYFPSHSVYLYNITAT